MEEEKKSHKLLITLIIILVALLGIAGSIGVWYWQGQEISGTVTSITYRENRAEDGYYGITVRNKNGKEYKINATGLMNTPPLPSEVNIICVKVPPKGSELLEGKEVRFKLPYDNSENEYSVCYKNSLFQKNNYFFTVE